ncbi:hypothetical protein AA0Z99_00205 [Agrococcus sp. 1P02AA]|uniref:hypothetical protein n=1 Tax=Agrococcus sp. 1P02AA TaxID=3132259 RepID=UPI0039A6FF4C
MTNRPVEWEVLHPLTGAELAVTRLVWHGPWQEPYFRVVSANSEREQRKLIGYWGTLDDAHTACLAVYERATGKSISGGDLPPNLHVPAQKPPPEPHTTGQPARPQLHSSRA